jgi:hypothetical protein
MSFWLRTQDSWITQLTYQLNHVGSVSTSCCLWILMEEYRRTVVILETCCGFTHWYIYICTLYQEDGIHPNIFVFSSLHDNNIPNFKHITPFAFVRLFQMWGMLLKAILLGTASTFLRCCASLLNLAMQSQCGLCLTTLWVIVLKYYFLVLATSMYVPNIGVLLNTSPLVLYICWLTWTLITFL